MARADTPQWFQLRCLTYVGGVGSTNEVNYCSMNGQDKLSGTIYAESVASHTVTGGPISSGSVWIQVNGVQWALPFNQGCGAPDYVWQAMVKTTDASAGGQYTWA